MLRLLLLEDSDDDAELIRIELEHAGVACELRRAWSRATLERALAEFDADVVVCDLNLPGYGGLEALELLQRERPRLPRVLVSGDPSRVPAGTDAIVLDKNQLSRLPGVIAALAPSPSR